MVCVICGSSATTTADPRLTRLRVALCDGCRDQLAYLTGWTRLRRNGRNHRWQRGGEIVELPA